MQLLHAQSLAIELMKQHGIYDAGWRFKFDNAKKIFGRCRYYNKTILLSKNLTLLNDESRVKNTILHEIAHALVGCGNGHNKVWKTTAKLIGCDGQRCYSSEVIQPPPKYIAICQGCKKIYKRERKSKSKTSCGFCSGGSYNEKYYLHYKKP